MDGWQTGNTKGTGDPNNESTALLPAWQRQNVCCIKGHLDANDASKLGGNGQTKQALLGSR